MKRVMFICETNSVYSQIAEGFAKHLGVGSIWVTSAGLEAGEVHSEVIAAMNEAGVDISRQTSKALSNFHSESFDVVIALCGCGENLLPEWVKREMFENWQLDDLGAQSEHFPSIRDEIRARVTHLIELIDSKQVLQDKNNGRANHTAN